MLEIRFHGRGGQGAVTAATILADAAFKEGKDVQSFPFFGVERRGAPVTAFTRIDDKPIRIKFMIYNPDYVIVLDPTLIGSVDVISGINENGLVLINTTKRPEELNLKTSVKIKVATVDATGIALRHGLGTRTAPILNTAILGAFARVSGAVKLDTLLKSIKEGVPRKKEENANAAKEAWEKVIY